MASLYAILLTTFLAFLPRVLAQVNAVFYVDGRCTEEGPGTLCAGLAPATCCDIHTRNPNVLFSSGEFLIGPTGPQGINGSVTSIQGGNDCGYPLCSNLGDRSCCEPGVPQTVTGGGYTAAQADFWIKENRGELKRRGCENHGSVAPDYYFWKSAGRFYVTDMKNPTKVRAIEAMLELGEREALKTFMLAQHDLVM